MLLERLSGVGSTPSSPGKRNLKELLREQENHLERGRDKVGVGKQESTCPVHTLEKVLGKKDDVVGLK